MIRFQRMSIHNKLALALWGAALLAFAVASVALGLFGSLTLERRARQIMEPYAQLVSVGAEAAVAFEDPERAREILTTLRANPQILDAEIVLRDGRLLAGYSSRSNATLRPHPLKPDGVYLNNNTAELVQSLHDDAHLYLAMSLDELNRQTRNVLRVFAAGVLVLLVAITMGLLAALQRTIVRPISTLAETVEQVRAGADYHQRVPASGADEVARLGQSFNAMMGAIQEREDDLRRLTLFQRTLLDGAAHGIISAAPDGIVNSFNPAAERLLGYTADEVVGKQTPACWHDPEEIERRALQVSEELGETIPPGFDVFAARPRRNLPEENEWIFICKDGMRVPVHLSVTALRNENGQITGYVGLTYDLTERKWAEEELRELNEQLEQRVKERTAELEGKNAELAESEARFRTIYETSPVSIWQEDWTQVIQGIRELRAQGVGDFAAYFREHPGFVVRALNEVKILDVNQWTLGMFAARNKADILASLGTVFSTADTLPGFIGELNALAQGQTVYRTEMALNTVKGDSLHGLLAMAFPPPDSHSGEVLVSVIDITERKNFEQALQKSEERMRLFFERQLVGMAITSPQKGWLQVNDKLCQMLGYSREELGHLTWTEMTYPEDLAPDSAQFDRLLNGEIEGYMLEKRFLRKDGSIVFTNLAVGCVRQGDRTVDYVLALLEDITERKRAEEAIRTLNATLEERVLERTAQLKEAIATLNSEITERKQAEEALHRLNRELRAISNCNQVLMRAADEQSLLGDICRIICDEAGYRMAWVGYAENDEARTVRPVAWAGIEDGYLVDADITWADTDRGRGPAGTAIRSGESACIQDFTTDPHWRDSALQRGYRSIIAFPLKDESENTFGVLCIYSTEPNAFAPDEIRLLEELSGDLAFGISVLRVRIKRKRAEEELRELNEQLEQRVKERTAELEGKNAELARMNRIFVGRELRMVELKERIRELENNKPHAAGENGSTESGGKP